MPMPSRGRCKNAVLNPTLGELCRLRRKVPACMQPSGEGRAAKGRGLGLPSGGSRCSLHWVLLGVPSPPCRRGCVPTLPLHPQIQQYLGGGTGHAPQNQTGGMAPQGRSARHRALGEQTGSSTPRSLMVPVE